MDIRKRSRALKLAILALAVTGLAAACITPVPPTPPTPVVIYNSNISPLPGNVSSQGFQCCQVAEFGDQIQLGGTATLRLPAAEAGRPVVALFNTERIVARAWPASENRIAMAELTY